MQKQDEEGKPDKTQGKQEAKQDKYSASPRGRGRGGRSSSVLSHRRGGHVQLVGKNTFAAPRAIIRPLGFTQPKPALAKKQQQDEEPKSNEDFRKMLLNQ